MQIDQNLNIKIDHKMLIAIKFASQRRAQHLKYKAKEDAEKQARRIRGKKRHLELKAKKKRKLVSEKGAYIILIDDTVPRKNHPSFINISPTVVIDT